MSKNNGGKKTKKFKSRHKIPLSESRREIGLPLAIMDFKLKRAFPDEAKRMEYIKSRIAELDKEIENGTVK